MHLLFEKNTNHYYYNLLITNEDVIIIFDKYNEANF